MGRKKFDNFIKIKTDNILLFKYKIEKKELSNQLNELCSMNSCNNLLYFETRKKKDLFLWLGRSPNGPSAKFSVENSNIIFHITILYIYIKK